MGFIALTIGIAAYLTRSPFSMILCTIYFSAALLFWFGAAGPWSHACEYISGFFSLITALAGFAGAALIILKYGKAAGDAARAEAMKSV